MDGRMDCTGGWTAAVHQEADRYQSQRGRLESKEGACCLLNASYDIPQELLKEPLRGWPLEWDWKRAEWRQLEWQETLQLASMFLAQLNWISHCCICSCWFLEIIGQGYVSVCYINDIFHQGKLSLVQLIPPMACWPALGQWSSHLLWHPPGNLSGGNHVATVVCQEVFSWEDEQNKFLFISATADADKLTVRVDRATGNVMAQLSTI